MPRTIDVEFKGPTDPALVHRIRNFGEDLYGEFLKNGQATMNIDEVDRATNKLHVTLAASRHLGSVMSLIKKTLQRHNLEELAAVKK